MKTRLAIGAAGLVLAGFGAYRALSMDPATWVSAISWLIGGVVLHDLVLSPVLVLLGVVLTRLVPGPWRAPAVVGVVVWGSLTLVAIPVLGRFGAKATDPWLLDRPYQLTWWIGFGVVAMVVVAAGFLRSRVVSRRAGVGARND